MATTTRTRNRPAPGSRTVPRQGPPPRATPRPAPPRPAPPRQAARGTQPRTGPAGRPASPVPRMPFIFLVVGLLGGGLVCLLVLNTILASGSFQLTSLQQSNTALAQQEQDLQQQIAQQEAPGTIGAEARNLGMRPVKTPHFVNLHTGHVSRSTSSQESGR